MLEMLDIGIDNAIAFNMSGRLTEEDMKTVLAAAEQKIARYGDIVFLEKISSIEGIELSAIVEEFRYMFRVGMSHIKKVAILTDKQWITKIATIEDKLFRSVDIRCFALEEQSAAIAFLQST